MAAAASLATLVPKLSHPIGEVRQRAVHSLRSKIDAGLLTADDLRLEPEIVAKLLDVVCRMESLPNVQLEALTLLDKLAAAADVSRKLVELGAVGELQRLIKGAAASDDAVASAASSTVDRILHHPAGELPLIHVPEETVEAEQRTPPPAQPTGAAAAAAAAAATAVRSLDFARHGAGPEAAQ